MSSDVVGYGVSAQANDGTLVELLRRLPATTEVELVQREIDPGSSVLDLGAGVGRIANPLAKLGYRVTAVDDSAALLDEVRGARTVCARIEELELGQRFDAVLLASSLINYPGTELRRAVLATVAGHLKPAGKALIQWRSPSWFASMQQGGGHRFVDGPLTRTMDVKSDRDGVLEGTVSFELDGQLWRQPVRAQRLTCAQIQDELHSAGMQLETSEPEKAEWLVASPHR
ncbi:class I SAM-dependent methyltransferase [Mycobacterium marinum]|uniref:class I SAM-dependent methyltransferase n=1 Tax=Mycobacterium marinum TaxID=1781 RepID=UPI0021C4C2F4|nr:class I SAM-dependent methyltransferase [Mycobacterium marinum]